MKTVTTETPLLVVDENPSSAATDNYKNTMESGEAKSKLSLFLSFKKQLSAAASVSLGFLTAGMVRAWASPAIPSMQGVSGVEDGEAINYGLSYAPLSKELVSWISSLAPLGALFGGLASSLPLEKLGRKKTLIGSSLLFITAFILLGTSSFHESLVVILISRGMMGFGVGLSIPAAQIYVSECSDKSIRGTLGSLPALFMALGTLLTYIVGAFLPWHYLCYFCVIFPFLLLVTMSLLPESPTWLMNKGKEKSAAIAMLWLNTACAIAELEEMKKNVERTNKNKNEDKSQASSPTPYFSRAVMMPLFISLSLMFFQQWCGVNAVIFYTVTIFIEAGSSIEKNLATVIVGIVQFLATFVSMFLVDHAGRRILLILSGIIMTIALAAVGAFFYLKEKDQHEGLEFIPLVGLIVFMIGYSVGFASIPFILMGELFPNQYRNQLGAISSSFNLTHTFLVIKLFTNLQVLVGLSGVFWIYAVVSFLSIFFVIIFLPETKGKSLEEIEKHFRKQETLHNEV